MRAHYRPWVGAITGPSLALRLVDQVPQKVR
jgi:hypothetical protein